ARKKKAVLDSDSQAFWSGRLSLRRSRLSGCEAEMSFRRWFVFRTRIFANEHQKDPAVARIAGPTLPLPRPTTRSSIQQSRRTATPLFANWPRFGLPNTPATARRRTERAG